MAEATDYSTYLRIDELLELQHPLTEGAHDEMLFVIVHQAFELWFKLILHELTAARDALLEARPQDAMGPLRRAVSVVELLIGQLGVLETMGPDGFVRFRDPLAPASGFQSFQFREIEALGGLLDAARVDELGVDPRHRGRIAGRIAEPSLAVALHRCATVMGLEMPEGDGAGERRLAALAALYHDHGTPERALLYTVCELLVDLDEALLRWRFHHVQMAAREIGRRPGTGGSAGVAYLEKTVEQRFFPELWAVRSHL